MTTVTIRQWGNGQGVRLTTSLLAQTGMHVGDELEVEIRDSSLVMSPKKNRIIHPRDINALFVGYRESFTPAENGFARAVGKECL